MVIFCQLFSNMVYIYWIKCYIFNFYEKIELISQINMHSPYLNTAILYYNYIFIQCISLSFIFIIGIIAYFSLLFSSDFFPLIKNGKIIEIKFVLVCYYYIFWLYPPEFCLLAASRHQYPLIDRFFLYYKVSSWPPSLLSENFFFPPPP